MAVRFKAKAVGVNGTSKTIEIDDSGTFIPPIEEFISLTDTGISIAYNPSDEHPHAPIIASSLTFELIQDTANASAINTLLADIVTSEEGRFRVILKDSSNNLEWIGYVMSDQIRRQDRDWADTVSVVRIRAKDGINRLKNIEYVPPSPLPNGRQTILAFLFDVIDDIDHADYFAATDDYLKSIVRWYETNMDSPTINDNPLSFAKVGKDAFRSRDNSGNSVYISSYKVLETICTIFGARFYLSGGCYRFEQIGEYRENGSIYQHRYYKDRTLHTTDSGVDLIVDENNEYFIRAAEGEYSYFAPLRHVELISKHSKNQNYLAGATWSNVSSVLENSGTIGTIDTALFFSGNLTVTPTVNTEFTPAYRYVFKIIVKASIGGTDYYLKRDYTYGPVSNVNYTIKEWTTNSADRYYYVTGSQIPNSDYEQVYGIGLTTPQLPTDSSLAEIEVQVLEHDIVRTSDGTTLSAVTIDWIFKETVLRIANNENPEEVSEETISILTNPDFINVSQELELKTLIADGPNLINAAIITTDTGVAFGDVATEEWTKGLTGTGKRIQYLLLEEIMKYRKTSIDQWSGVILDGSSYQYHNLMKLTTNDVYVPLTCEYRLGGKTEQWEGVWFKSDFDNTAIDTSTIEDQELGGLTISGSIQNGDILDSESTPIGSSFTAGGQIGSITDDDVILDSTVTSIPIQQTGVSGLISNGDVIKLVTSSGTSQQFTVTADVGPTDASISVTSTTATSNFGAGSFVTVANSTYVQNVQSGTTVSGKVNRYRELFDNVTTASLTVTENSGTLPANTDLIDVHYNGRLLTEGASYDYQVSGSNINFTFTPRGTVRVMITFWIID